MNNRQKLVQKQFLNREEEIIKRLDEIYKQSLQDVNEKLKELTFKIGKLQEEYDWMDPDDPKRAEVKSKIQSKIYQRRYQEQLHEQISGVLDQMKVKQYTDVVKYLDDCYIDGYIGTQFDLHGQGVPITTPIDQESMVRAVQLESKISKGLYTRLGEDVDLLKRKITSHVSRGIASGMNFADVAVALKGTSNVGYNKAIRIARTEGHRIQCSAAMDACTNAKEMGADVVKQWDATLDGRTRESHAQVDGEIRELDKRFSNGLMYPGDPSGGAAEVVNCRCALLQRARWALEDGFTKMNGFTRQLEEFESPKQYNEFKDAFFSKENRSYMNYVQQMQDKYGIRDFPKLLAKMSDREYNHYSELLAKNPVYNKISPEKVLTKSSESGIIKSFEVGKSLGAKAKNYQVKLLDSRQHVKLAEGQTIKGVAFAGKGTNTEIREKFRLEADYKIPADKWEKVSGTAFVIIDGKRVKAEVHWYEADGEIVEMKVKRYLE